jgi:hypothetical protein
MLGNWTLIKNCHELIHRKLLGENLGSCSVQELKELEAQLEKSLSIIRQRKARALHIPTT